MSWALLAPAGWVLQGDVGRAPSWPASWRHHPSHPWRWVPARAALKGAQRARLLLLPEAGSCPSTPGALNIGTAGLWPPPLRQACALSHGRRRWKPTEVILLAAPQEPQELTKLTSPLAHSELLLP